MTNQLSPFSPNLQNRYTNTQRSRHTKFDLGMIRDVASWELPEGACYDTVDTLCDYVGKIRKRGGTTSPSASNRTATAENLASFRSNGFDALTAVAGSSAKTGAIYLFDRATGATTKIPSGAFALSQYAGRPFQHLNYLVFPFQQTDTTTTNQNVLAFYGGSTGAAAVFPTTGTITANDNRITFTGTTLTSAHLGMCLALNDVAAANLYVGRIVEVTSGTAIRVDPIPTKTFSFIGGSSSAIQPAFSIGNGTVFGAGWDAVVGRFGVSFQGRMVMLDCVDRSMSNSAAKGVLRYPRRLYWGVLPTERSSIAMAGVSTDGDPNLLYNPFSGTASVPFFNWTEIPSLQTATGLAAVGDGQLVIFGPQQMYRLSGQLTTETIANNSLAYSVDLVSNNIGCISNRSIQYCRGGIVFAGNDNIYEYDGSSLKPLLQGTNSIYYQDRLRSGETIHGSAYATNRNHYLLSMSGSDGTLMLNLNYSPPRMTRTTNVNLFDSCPDPDDATKLWGARWWDTTAAAPTMTKGQLIGLESIWLPTSANKSDADGTAVLSLTKTAAYVNGALAANKMTVDVNVTADLRGASSPTATVKADTKLNVSDASFTTLGTIAAGTTAGSKSFPVGYQVAEGAAVEIQIGNDAACDSFELLGLDFGTQSRPEEFSS